ncbi:CG0192-related protein [Pseudonocardia adelaidensis]|uniref:CG0192-related protein n=1 Tax=Pseudonocardia adelaidensis TaxID=648754 RepID=UPI0031EF1047
MALIHRARITPTKAELIADWLPSRTWAAGAVAPFEFLGAYRFDDPSGEVGIETHLVRAGNGDVLQVPLTYRATPLEGAERHLVGTMEHTHLGRRWVYDGCGDPVYVAAVVATIRTGGREAAEWVESDGAPVRREPTARVSGSGSTAAPVPAAEPVDPVDGAAATTIGGLVVLRVVGRTERPDDADFLTGTWRGSAEPALLAYLPR